MPKLTFKEKVFQIVRKIPKGKTLSYKEVAERTGNKKACRAVGNILNKHKIKGLPCHRVVKSNGDVGGYQWGKKMKIKILRQEGVKISKKGKIID
jgi:O-6-methylguanine DNA methyltransferase